MTDSVQVNLAVGQVYVERTQPNEYVVYRPSTLEVFQVLETREAAVGIGFNRMSDDDLSSTYQ
ncbi:MAG TPA: hypothetical protein VKK79_10260 [Candidatus Lokiarchaeia archaeon]|nr:hypothetical protein [Candidatus Lokiarchaeia archaeon]